MSYPHIARPREGAGAGIYSGDEDGFPAYARMTITFVTMF